MGARGLKILIFLILNSLRDVLAEHILSCNGTDVESHCPGLHDICNVTSGQCYCEAGFVRYDDECRDPNTEPATRSDATIAVVTIFTLALVICGLVLVFRKYNVVDYIRQKINSRRNTDVVYEDVMIGQDDPPLSP